MRFPVDLDFFKNVSLKHILSWRFVENCLNSGDLENQETLSLCRKGGGGGVTSWERGQG